jgi:hypothetical protein
MKSPPFSTTGPSRALPASELAPNPAEQSRFRLFRVGNAREWLLLQFAGLEILRLQSLILFLRTYRHLYESKKRSQAQLLESLVRRHLDATWTSREEDPDSPLNEAESDDGRTWDRTRDLPRVKRALSR